MEGAQAVGRAVEILRAVARCQRSGATLSKIMNVTDLSRSTTFRLLRYLSEERLLEFDEQQRSYYIGPLAYELGLAAKGQAGLVAERKESIDRIAAKTGLTTYLTARSDTEIVCLAASHGVSVVRAVTLDVGQRLPLGIGAGSLALLSSLPDAEVDAVLTSNSAKIRMYGEGRLTPKILKQRVETTRAKGYAFSQDSVAKGVAGVGVVISSPDALTQLAVSVSSVAGHMDTAERERMADTIRKMARI
jgi:DNA-binding IclR family transcriptional regulator